MRRGNSDAAGGVVIVVAISLVVSAVVYVLNWIADHAMLVAVFVAVVVAVVLMSLIAERKKKSDIAKQATEAARLTRENEIRHHNAQLSLARNIITVHASELTIQRRQLTTSSRYGLTNDSMWRKEVEFFIDEIVEPHGCDLRNNAERLADVRAMINSATAEYETCGLKFSNDIDPLDYERLVADTLSDLGWHTRLTQASGDQGIDVIAKMRDKTVVIQCKRYASPVGNLAVQEAYAGMAFQNAHYAAVVSNAPFTVAARRLSKSTRVILLHHDELTQLEERIFNTESWRSLGTIVPKQLPAAFPTLPSVAPGVPDVKSSAVIDHALRFAGIGAVGSLIVVYLNSWWT